MNDTAPVDDVAIRMAAPEESRSAADLRWLWDVENDVTPSLTLDEFRAAFAAWASAHRATHTCFLAERNGEGVGMAWIAITPRVPTPRSTERRTADVQSVYVVPELRGSGTGTRLLDAALARARVLGVERVLVHSSTAAVRLYERAGFAVDPLVLNLETRAG